MSNVGFFLNHRAAHGAICAYELCEQLNALGHDAKIYARDFDEHAPEAIRRHLSVHEIEEPSWWERERLDTAIFYNATAFSRRALESARQAGVIVVIECDSDGFLSFSQAPLKHLCQKTWDSRYSLLSKLRLMKAWGSLLLRRHELERTLFANLDAAHYIKIESAIPAGILRAFLQQRGRPDLAQKVLVIPFAVRTTFTEDEIHSSRSHLIVAAGRLGAQQKNPLFLARILLKLLTEAPQACVELHIRGDASEFDELSRFSPRLTIRRDSSPDSVAESLSRARVFVSSSRWETTPIIGLEALCMGCTLVAPSDLPGYQSLIGAGECGRGFPRNSVRLAVRALQAELAAWSNGQRDPSAIASFWRKQCALPTVARQWIQLLEKHRADRRASEQMGQNHLSGAPVSL